ncbi:UDP-glucose dehydrogenase family protein [Pleomorphochaeta sp. DL1XJH-081]|jgi:UDPglucose 6-dehydrogenase|uniref:UDP-glucose dehydrogenase family protein n=1 Tax=Pleomorphochaeta sp. DL1XJH-081 TaxID=3409690 RepID=UPI003BB757B4
MANIAVIGTGYVGLVSGALLSDFGHSVICVDIDTKKIERLEKGEIPIFEPGLEPIVKNNTYYKRLIFTTDLAKAVKTSEVIFIAVGTPPADDGSADLQYVLAAAKGIAEHMDDYKVIVDKSTVPIGTGQKVKNAIKEVLVTRKVDIPFDVVSNPEFLREGSAVQDFTHPDRVVIGAESEKALNVMKDVYQVLFINETPFVETDIETAEMIKYASNAFLAMKITFINELANVCEEVGANIQKVAKAMGQDGRISPKFLHAGPGYGGSCFPKDTKALAEIARGCGQPMSLMDATVTANERQKLKMVEKIEKELGKDLKGATIAILGVTFKPNTDDMREAPSLVILPALAKKGVKLRISDPQGYKEGSWRFGEIAESITWCNDAYEAVEGSDATVILTEWNHFRTLDFSRYEELGAKKILFDLRNIFKRQQVEEMGFVYHGVGV